MDIGMAFSSFLTHKNVSDEPIVAAIEKVEVQEIGQEKERKPVLFLEGQAKGLVLNKTNANTIAALYGPETDLWTGKMIELYATKCTFMGQLKDCIRVREPQE